jgi:cell division protein FtsW
MSATPARGQMRRGIGVMKGRVQLVAEDVTAGIDGWLLIVIAGLCCFGLVMVYSASEALGYLWYQNVNYFFERQLLCMGFGAIALAVTARIDYHRWRVLTKPVVLFTLALMILVLVPHVGVGVNGAQRWFSLGFVTLQPSEIAAVVAIIGFSRWLTDRKPELHTWRSVRDYTVILTALIGLILLERDLGTAIVSACVAYLLLVLAGARKKHLLILMGVMAVGAYVGIHMEAYRLTRISSFANPFADPLNSGFQSVQALLAFGSGGFTGVGLGNSIEKYQWLPEAHTDFIFAIIGEELGLIGTLCVVGAFIFLVWRGVRAARRAPDFYGTLLAGGITAWIGFQAFINIAAVTGLTPTTGIPLPFISYGGTALVMTLFGLGILCNVSAQGRRQGEPRRAYVDRWWGNRGASDSRAGGRRGAAFF